jgi:hypothetical protein
MKYAVEIGPAAIVYIESLQKKIIQAFKVDVTKADSMMTT